jgi:FAD dependent oxidoreductase
VGLLHDHWSYSVHLTTGWKLIFGMPIEELVFFIVVPICGLLTYQAVGQVLGHFMIIGRRNARWRPGRDARAVRHPARPGATRLTEVSRPVVVAGSGIAGIAAAIGLAERGVPVIMVEPHKQLGGRVRSWPVTHGDDQVTMSRGFTHSSGSITTFGRCLGESMPICKLWWQSRISADLGRRSPRLLRDDSADTAAEHRSIRTAVPIVWAS